MLKLKLKRKIVQNVALIKVQFQGESLWSFLSRLNLDLVFANIKILLNKWVTEILHKRKQSMGLILKIILLYLRKEHK